MNSFLLIGLGQLKDLVIEIVPIEKALDKPIGLQIPA